MQIGMSKGYQREVFNWRIIHYGSLSQAGNSYAWTDGNGLWLSLLETLKVRSN